MTHIAEFDRWEKPAGSDGELESLAYIERCLRDYGYGTALVKHPAYISLPVGASLRVNGKSVRCITHSFSRSTGPRGLEAAVAYVGAGRPADYAGRDVAGRIVLVEGIANPAAAAAATAAGAAGQIHISPHEHLHEMCISPVWGSPSDDLVERLPKTAVVTVSFTTGAELKSLVEHGSDPAVHIETEVDTRWRPTPILQADLMRPGADGADPMVLFTGHHDAWYRGVMDNGGANATMLEVARICASHISDWRRGIRILFWSGHSQGRYSSSAWYADHHWEELEERAVAHVNVDSTGGAGNTVVSDTTASAELAGLARATLETVAGQEFSGRRMSRAGDQSFWGIGVPSIYGNMSEQPASAGGANAMAAVFGGGSRLGHGTGWWWHTPADTADKIDADLLVRDTQIYQWTVWRLLTDEVLPIDYRDAAGALRDRLRALAEVSAGFDMGPLLRRADELVLRCDRLYAAIDAGRLESTAANATIVKLSRSLVPIDYTVGDRFGHDPALAQLAVPALSDLTRLAELGPDTDQRRFLETRLIRERNRVAHGLRSAIAVVDAALETNDAGPR